MSPSHRSRERLFRDKEAMDGIIQEDKTSSEVSCAKEHQTKLDRIEMHKSYSSELEEDLAMFDNQTAWVDPESPPGEEEEERDGDNIILL